MSRPGYIWRSLTPAQRTELLAARLRQKHPWHSPPHRPNHGHLRFHLTAACYEHAPHIGHSAARLDDFSTALVNVLTAHSRQVYAWCVLPNHYHALVEAPDILILLRELGRHHGRTSHAWNGEQNTRGRKVFFRAVERAMRSDRHFWASLNYVHHNPVHHGYVVRWTDWPWSSASPYLAQTGPTDAARIWHDFPIRDYGQGWDDPGL